MNTTRAIVVEDEKKTWSYYFISFRNTALA